MAYTRRTYANGIAPALNATNLNALEAAVAELKNVALSPLDSGAIGDGVVDDTAALQTILTALRLEGGGALIVPPGYTFLTTADLVVGSGTTMLLYGTIKRASTVATVAVIKNYDYNYGGADTDIHIIGLGGTIYRAGEATIANTAWDNTVSFKGATRVSVKNCRVRGSAKSIHFSGCADWEISGNWLDTFVDNGIATTWDEAAPSIGNGRIVNNFLASPTASGFTLGSSGIICTQSGVVISDNVAVDQASNFLELGNDCSDVLIEGNVAKWTGKANVNNSILMLDVTDIMVRANRLDKGFINASVNVLTTDINERISYISNTVSLGVISMKKTEGGQILGNLVYNCTGNTINVQSCADVHVAHNYVEGGSGAGFAAAGVGGGAPYANKRIRFESNVVVDKAVGASAAFYADGGDNVEFVRNRAYDTGGAVCTHGIYINATTNYKDFENDFAGCSTAERRTDTTAPTRASGHGSLLGFFTKAGVVQAAAYTQTYATAARVVPAEVVAITGGEPPTEAEHNLLVADVLALKKLLNALIDDSQGYGLVAP